MRSSSVGVVEVSKIDFPLVVVLTPDCYLEQDFNGRAKEKQESRLLSVLVVPLYNAEQLFMGEHFSDLNVNAIAINRKATEGKTPVQSERPRYHRIDFPMNVPLVASIGDVTHTSLRRHRIWRRLEPRISSVGRMIHSEKICLNALPHTLVESVFHAFVTS